MDQRALAILEQVLSRGDRARHDALAVALCRGDPALLARVRSLLAQITGATALPGSPDAGSCERTDAPPHERIGPFRPIRALGRGGMGVVWLAERADGGFEQRVALKLIRGASPALAGRFLRERRILARLTHPGVAHLVDGGLTGDGQPWFAMDYVEGEPIDAWCDAQRLGLRARVELFLSVCEAVRFAHRNLIVHRDIKPANILVGADGAPRLLDFGIARLLDEAEPTSTLSLTPAYASPEQLRGEPASTACDLYQLGLVLYELLCGVPAHAARARDRHDGERGTPVPRPDAALRAFAARDADALRHIAELRRTHPDRLLRALRGDLARILATTLAHDPDERYVSVDALMQDLDRWRRDLPVRARRGGVAYRTGKFLRRNWAASAAVLLLLIASGYYLLDLRENSRRIRAERDQAQAIAGFMQELFSAADPRMRPGAETTARELLAVGAQRIGAAAPLADATRANLLATIARSHQSIGLYPEALALYRQALALLGGGDDGERLALRARVLADAASAAIEANHQGDAEGHFRAASALLERLSPDDGLPYAHALGAAAAAQLNLYRPGEAANYYDRLLALRDELFERDPRFFCDALLTSAGNLEVLLRTDEAAVRTQDAVAAYERAFGTGHPDYGRALAQLADQETDLRRYAEAEHHYALGIAAMRRALGDDHRDVAIKLNNQALMHIRLGRFDEARALLDEALPILRTVFGADNSYVAAALHNLGTAFIGLERTADAAAALAEAQRIIDADPRSVYHARIVHAQARLACLDGDLDAALAGFDRAAAEYGDDRFRMPALAWHRADCLLRHDRAADARALLPAAIAGLRAALGDDAWDTRQAEQALSRLQQALRQGDVRSGGPDLRHPASVGQVRRT